MVDESLIALERRRALERERYWANREKMLEKSRKYNSENKEKIAARKKQWALDNPDKVNRHQKEHPEKRKIYNQTFRERHPERAAIYARKHNYGVTQEWFDNKLQEQNGLCVICSSEMIKPSVDHNHTTGVVREILCHLCNVMLGYAQDNPNRLISGAEYLRKHEAVDG